MGVVICEAGIRGEKRSKNRWQYFDIIIPRVLGVVQYFIKHTFFHGLSRILNDNNLV